LPGESTNSSACESIVVLCDLDAGRVILELRAPECDAALREIVAVMARGGDVREPKKFIEQVLAREKATSTFVGHGVAFPHARTELVDDIVLGIGRSAAGVEFGQSGERAHLIFLLAVPIRMVTDYLVCVGALARITKEENTRAALMNAGSTGEFVEILREAWLLLK
jgi:mannitol/fructose-specific phosphotransferase system IIA component (Ntr-type)